LAIEGRIIATFAGQGGKRYNFQLVISSFVLDVDKNRCMGDLMGTKRVASNSSWEVTRLQDHLQEFGQCVKMVNVVWRTVPGKAKDSQPLNIRFT
jgi:hypothetical protein